MKRMTALALALATSLVLASCGGTGGTSSTANTDTSGSSGDSSTASAYADLDSVSIIGADSTAANSVGQMFGETVAEKVSEITGGKLTIDYYPNGELGADADLLRQLQSDDIQLVVCQTAPVVSFVPDVAVYDLPMAFAQYDGETIDSVINGDGEFATQLGASFNEAGLQLMGTLQNATYRLTTANVNLQTLADFNGLMIRTMENPNHMAFWSAIGAAPTPMAWNEVYFALQSGNIAAEENAADTIVGANLDEVQDYLACTNHILYANMMIMNQEAYDALDPLYQEALAQAVSETMEELGSQIADVDQQNKDELVNRGMTLIEYDNAFFEEVLAVQGVQDLYTEIDTATNGLATTLQEELAAAAGA